jgi:hypothetical protein
MRFDLAQGGRRRRRQTDWRGKKIKYKKYNCIKFLFLSNGMFLIHYQ